MHTERRYKVIYFAGDDGWLVGAAPEVPGCASQGRTVEDLMTNMREAIEGCILGRREMNLPERVEIQEATVTVAARHRRT